MPTGCPSGVSIQQDLDGEYPFTPHAITLDGHRYHFVDEGQGPVLLFVHGNPTWSFAWRHFIRALRGQFRCLAVDHIGCGRSDKPGCYPYTLAQHVSNLNRLIQTLDLRDITLVGHDWGGCIGMGAAVAAPERFSRFVLCNTAAFHSGRIPLRIALCRIPALGGVIVRGLNGFARAALKMAVCDRRRITPAVRAGYLAPYDSWSHRVAIHEFVRDIPLSRRHRSYDLLAEIEVGLSQFSRSPVLLLWGQRDWCFTTKFVDEWRRRFPHAEVTLFADAGHYVFEDAREAMLERMREFLQSHRSSGTILPGML